MKVATLDMVSRLTHKLIDKASEKSSDQSGLISFLVVMFISALLVIITAGFAQVMIRELRQSTDNELSAMAYYAAESTTELAMLRIKQALENGNINDAHQEDCESSEFSDNVTGYSCLIIDVEPTSLEGRLPVDTSRQFNFREVNHSQISLAWHQRGGDYDDPAEVSFVADNPAAADWTDGAPAIMRLEIVSYPGGEEFDIEDGIEQKVVFLRPSSSGANAVSLGSIDTDQNMRNVRCSATVELGDYACSITITGMDPTRSYVAHLKPFYTGTNYRLQALQSGTAQEIPGNSVVIDATGYANDVFRRLQTQIPLHSDNVFGQHYVLMADEGVCKNMRVSRLDPPLASVETGCE